MSLRSAGPCINNISCTISCTIYPVQYILSPNMNYSVFWINNYADSLSYILQTSRIIMWIHLRLHFLQWWLTPLDIIGNPWNPLYHRNMVLRGMRGSSIDHIVPRDVHEPPRWPINPFFPTVAFNICCPRDRVSRHNGGTAGAPLKRVPPPAGAPAVAPLCRDTQSLGQQMLERWEKMGHWKPIRACIEIPAFLFFLQNRLL